MSDAMSECSDGDERLVLSEVHVGSSLLDEEPELVSRYTYVTPSNNHDDDDDSSSSSSSEVDQNDDGCYSVARHRKRPREETTSTMAPHQQQQQRCSRPAHEVLTIVHRMATTLGLVGQQVWSAAFLLGDFVLAHEVLFAGMQVVELGAGPGVAGLIAARVARRCYLTDYHHEVLKLLARNAEANRHLFGREGLLTGSIIPAVPTPTGEQKSARVVGGGEESNSADTSGGDVVAVRELDWFTFYDEVQHNCFSAERRKPAAGKEDKSDNSSSKSNKERGASSPFAWREGELEGLLLPPWQARKKDDDGLVILAADVIYDEGLTEALFEVLKLLMPPPPLRRLATEKGGPGGAVFCEENSLRADFIVSGNGRRGGGGDGGTTTTAEAAADVMYDSGGEEEGVAEVDRHATLSGVRSRGGERSPVVGVDSDGRPALIVGATPSLPPFDSGQAVEEGKRQFDGRQCPVGVGAGEEAVLYLALEKRYNFSLAELSVAATGYGALLKNVLDVTDGGYRGMGAENAQGQGHEKAFEGVRLPLTFQQCFRYQRSDAMELWEIRRRPLTGGK